MRHVVICPGSRNAPLVMAFVRFKKIECISIVDERSAAFIALGMAKQLQQPVAIICTSGTAVLNLYPAIAEAFYMQVPLLVITADRPAEMIDRWDGQTIHQFEVFKPHILGSFQTPEDIENNKIEEIFSITRQFFETALGLPSVALQTKQAGEAGKQGPSHLNVPLKEPLYAAVADMFEYSEPTFGWSPFKPNEADVILKFFSSEKNIQNLSIVWSGDQPIGKVLILHGAQTTENEIEALKHISQNKYAIVIADVISNKHQYQNIGNWEGLLLNLNEKQKPAFIPDILITTGKMVLNITIKQLLRKYTPTTHLHITENGYCADAFNSKPQIIQTSSTPFFHELNKILPTQVSEYYNTFSILAQKKLTISNNIIQQNYNEFNAVKLVLENLGDNLNLHLANSLSVRYAAYLANCFKPTWQIHSNRGVSGIDGCTSTAIGAALVDTQQHILITGDIAFFYDINAFWQQKLPNNFKVILLNNFGGNIFKVIDGPAKMPELNPYLETPHTKNAALMAHHFNVNYYVANCSETLANTLPQWLADSQCAILEIQTDSNNNTHIFNQYKNTQL